MSGKDDKNLQQELMRMMQSGGTNPTSNVKVQSKTQGNSTDQSQKKFDKKPNTANNSGDNKALNKPAVAAAPVSSEPATELSEHQLNLNRIKIVTLNQKIAQHASRKELQQAYELYQEALTENLANLHTYAAMVNTAVRCANMTVAEEVVNKMKSQGRKLKDVVLYTTLMKGYCAQGMLQKALDLYLEMLNKIVVVQPNVRTVNTILRGCVQMGEIHVAEMVFNHAQKDLKIPLDVSSWEYLVTLLAQGLQLDKLLPIIGRLKSDEHMQTGVASMNINLARAAVLLGEWKTCRKALAQATAAMDPPVGGADGEQGGAGGESSITNAKKSVVGGKRAWKSQGEDPLSVDERRNQSLILYREHIREEWRQEVQLLTEFVDRLQEEQQKASKSSKVAAYEYLFPFFYHLLSFDASQETPSADRIRKQVFRSVCYKFGLDAFLKKTADYDCVELLGETIDLEIPTIDVKAVADEDSDDGEDDAEETPKETATDDKKQKKQQHKKKASKSVSVILRDALTNAPGAALKSTKVDAAKAESFKSALQGLKACVSSYFSDEGFINFTNVFTKHALFSKQSPDLQVSQAVKMEICSGAGEWAVTQAKNDPTSPWVTLELRHDRVHQTATKMMYAGIHNLCVMGGDAMQVLPRHIQSDSVGHIFVNHPEPPQQTGGETSEGFHLLNEDFFKQVDRVLLFDGKLTIVTDNLWYGKFLVRLLNGLPTRLKSLSSKDSSLINSSWTIQFENDGVVLWEGEPGKEAGHVVEASSYFDRLWKRGQLQERYFIVLRKTNTVSRTKLKIPLQISATVASKKIKFGDDDEDEDVAAATTVEVDAPAQETPKAEAKKDHVHQNNNRDKHSNNFKNKNNNNFKDNKSSFNKEHNHNQNQNKKRPFSHEDKRPSSNFHNKKPKN